MTTTTDTTESFTRDIQVTLWSDLCDAIHGAIDGVWSMRAGGYARAIVRAARLVGPIPHEECPWELVAGGVYAAVYAVGGVRVELPTEDEWTRLDELMSPHGLTRALCGPAYAATVMEMRSIRERAWISGRGE